MLFTPAALKLGNLLIPRPQTCAGFEASYQHELPDAQHTPRGGLTT